MVSLGDALLILIFSLFIHPSIKRLVSFIQLKNFPYMRLNIDTLSPERAYASFVSCALLSEHELATKRASYSTLSRANKPVASKIGYECKLLKAYISMLWLPTASPPLQKRRCRRLLFGPGGIWHMNWVRGSYHKFGM